MEVKAPQILIGDCIESMKTLPDQSVDCCITSPPYWGLRDYGTEDQLGLEETPEEYVQNMVRVFGEVKRILKDEGTLWLNLGDTYSGSGKGAWSNDEQREKNAHKTLEVYIPTRKEIPLAGKIAKGLKNKDLVGIPWRVAFALQADGWYLRQDIIWHKPNPMPESVTDRCTKAHEYIFLLSKSRHYYFDSDSIKEPASPDDSIRDRDITKLNNTPGRTKMKGLKTNHYTTKNKRSVWTVSTKPYSGAHFATFPEDLIEPCVLAGCPKYGTIIDPFGGSGTTGQVALKHNRNSILCEINPDYVKLMHKRIKSQTLSLPL